MSDVWSGLLGNCPAREFFTSFYGSSPLHCKSSGFSDAWKYSSNDMFAAIHRASRVLTPNLFQMIKDTRALPFSEFSRSIKARHGRRQIVEEQLVRGLMESGSTVVLHEMRAFIPSIQKECLALEQHFPGWISTNSYLTPQDRQGFPPHCDSHDVFILQMEGSKTWTIEANVVNLNGSRAKRGNTSKVHMDPGDLLYIPTGVKHYAVAGRTNSLHLTLGLHLIDIDELFSRLLSELPPSLLKANNLFAWRDSDTSLVINPVVVSRICSFISWTVRKNTRGIISEHFARGYNSKVSKRKRKSN